MTHPSSKHPLTRLVYAGDVLTIEFYVAPNGTAPAEEWLEQLSLPTQQHGFKKAGDKAPKREIDRAEAYKEDFERRVGHEKQSR